MQFSRKFSQIIGWYPFWVGSLSAKSWICPCQGTFFKLRYNVQGSGVSKILAAEFFFYLATGFPLSRCLTAGSLWVSSTFQFGYFISIITCTFCTFWQRPDNIDNFRIPLIFYFVQYHSIFCCWLFKSVFFPTTELFIKERKQSKSTERK